MQFAVELIRGGDAKHGRRSSTYTTGRNLRSNLTIQGEGSIAGMRTHFVRVGGCDGLPSGHCSWCDSMHAVDPPRVRLLERLTPYQIAQRVLVLPGPCRTLTISGGNPLLYDLTDLVQTLGYDWTFWVETQGTIYRDWIDMCNVTVSPKPPSAGRCDIERLEEFFKARAYREDWVSTCVKIPVDPGFQDGADLDFARMIFERCAVKYPEFSLSLSVVTRPEDEVFDLLSRWDSVIEWAKLAPIPDVRVLSQLHVLLYGHRQGV